MFRHALLLLAAPTLCAGHGNVIKPPSWQDTDGTHGMNQPYACSAGCTGRSAPGEIEAAQGCVCEWYTNYTFIPGEPTIPPLSPLLTYKDACQAGLGSAPCCNAPCTDPSMQEKGKPCVGCDWSRTSPWRSPGSAPVFSPCGFDGGNPKGCPVGNPGGGGCAGGGYGHGPDGRTLAGKSKIKSTEWQAGTKVETMWRITANHGGGYQYRICKKPTTSMMDLTEECFQKTPLPFVGNTQWLQYGADESNRTEIPAMTTSTGTTPTGSQWRRIPLPACIGFDGGSAASNLCTQPQFDPPVPGAFGFFGSAQGSGHATKGRLRYWAIVDQLQLPSDLVPGAYVLSFRYDCEQTIQVWNTCADIQITSAPPSPPSPSPPSGCPGGSYSACISLCPSDPAKDYKACLDECKKRCDPSESIAV